MYAVVISCGFLSSASVYFSSSVLPGLQAVNTVEQKILIVNEEEKKSYVFDFIRNMEPLDKVLIFVRKKIM